MLKILLPCFRVKLQVESVLDLFIPECAIPLTPALQDQPDPQYSQQMPVLPAQFPEPLWHSPVTSRGFA